MNTQGPSSSDLEDFFELGPVGLHLVGSDGTILRANRAELEMLGFAPAEYIGHNIAEFHVDQAVIKDILARLLRGELIRRCETRMRAKDGSIKHVLLDSSGHFRGSVFVNS